MVDELEPAPVYERTSKTKSPPLSAPPPRQKKSNKLFVVISVGAGCVLAAVTAMKLGAGLERERLKLVLERERLERERERHKGNFWKQIVGTVVSVTVKIALTAVVSSLTSGGGGSCSGRDPDCGRVTVLYNDNQVNFVGGNNQLVSN